MTTKDPTTLLQELLQDGRQVASSGGSGINRFRQRGLMMLRNIFGDDSPHVLSWARVNFRPRAVSFDASRNEALQNSAHASGMAVSLNLLETAIEELETFGGGSMELSPTIETSRRVFVVHGHDDGLKQTVARTLERLDLEPIILHEKPNEGRTIIEKFEDYADVSFAVVLLTPDDMGYRSGDEPSKARPRARQNVILELGFFLGKLGRRRVAALYAGDETFEKPSDYDGVLFIPVDGPGQWQYSLVKELKAADIDVDANKIT